jgi:hypothetical protein
MRPLCTILLYIAVAFVPAPTVKSAQKPNVQKMKTPQQTGPETATRFTDRAGWQIPAFEEFETKQPDTKFKTAIDGKPIEISIWNPERVRRQQGRCRSVLIPHAATVLAEPLNSRKSL